MLLSLVLLASCKEKGNVIPRSDMVRIYADIFLADQWLTERGDLSKMADTTMFYEPIFEKYGYSTLDYVTSVNHYLKDPVRFSRMLEKTRASLDGTSRHLQAYKDALEDRKMDEARIRSYDPKIRYYYNLGFIVNAEKSVLRMEPIDTCGRYWPQGMPVTNDFSYLKKKKPVLRSEENTDTTVNNNSIKCSQKNTTFSLTRMRSKDLLH